MCGGEGQKDRVEAESSLSREPDMGAPIPGPKIRTLVQGRCLTNSPTHPGAPSVPFLFIHSFAVLGNTLILLDTSLLNAVLFPENLWLLPRR